MNYAVDTFVRRRDAEPQARTGYVLARLRDRGARLALALALLPLGALAVPALAQDGAFDPAAHAFVEVAAERGHGYVGEAVRVQVRFGFEQVFLAERMIQPFRRRLDVPAQIEAPWLAAVDAFDGARVLAAGEADGGASVAVGDRVLRATRVGELDRGGARFRAFALEQSFVPAEPGELRLAAPVLRFAHATRFEDDLLAGRSAADRRDDAVTGDALVVPIRPLPPGAPPGFTGAVGRYAATASAAPLELVAGASLRLELVLAGEGDLFGFAAPELEELTGFHHRGHLERRDEEGRRVIAYDLAPRSADVEAVPPIEVPFFDPERETWDAARTAAIPLRVRPRAGGERAAAPEPGGNGEAPPAARGALVAAAAGVVLVVLALLVARRRRRSSARA
jgi:hypothetical protein